MAHGPHRPAPVVDLAEYRRQHAQKRLEFDGMAPVQGLSQLPELSGPPVRHLTLREITHRQRMVAFLASGGTAAKA
jgi:hypothetical protein